MIVFMKKKLCIFGGGWVVRVEGTQVAHDGRQKLEYLTLLALEALLLEQILQTGRI